MTARRVAAIPRPVLPIWERPAVGDLPFAGECSCVPGSDTAPRRRGLAACIRGLVDRRVRRSSAGDRAHGTPCHCANGGDLAPFNGRADQSPQAWERLQHQVRCRLRADLLPGIAATLDALTVDSRVTATPSGRRLLAELTALVETIRSDDWDPADLTDNAVSRAIRLADRLRCLALSGRGLSVDQALASLAGVPGLGRLALRTRSELDFLRPRPGPLAARRRRPALTSTALRLTVAEGGAMSALAPPRALPVGALAST